ncbi:hypothetical protein MASR1M107_05200 [Ignavibacteriales bacterium]
MTRLFILLALALPLYAQSYKPTYQSNPNLNLDSVLAGVKTAQVLFGTSWQKKIDDGIDKEIVYVINQYFKYLGFQRFAITSEQQKNLTGSIPTDCDNIDLNFWWRFGDTYLDIGIQFITCKGDFFNFEISKPLQEFEDSTDEFADYMLKEWKKLYTRKKIYYNVNQRLTLPKLPTNWTEKSVMRYLDSANIESLEGIYEIVKNGSEKITLAKYKIAVVKSDKLTYNVIYLSGATNYEDWDEGELKAVLRKTAIPGNYKVQWYMGAKSINEDVYMEHHPKGFLIFQIGTPPETNRYIKLYPIKW